MDILSELGAAAVGVAPYRVLEEHRLHLDEWLECGNEAELGYMREHRREDPHIVFAECRSLIVVLFAPQKWSYHNYIRRRLKRLLTLLKSYDPELEGRGVVDSAPLLERAWGVEASLGWVGRNSMLINPCHGSDFNIGVLLTSAEVEDLLDFEPLHRAMSLSRVEAEDGCVGCDSPCMELCPSGAILDNRTIDSRLCHSYLSQRPGAEGVLGCTICQRCCPYNNAM